MQQNAPEMIEQATQILGALDAQMAYITEELKNLATVGDWDAIKSIVRVLDAHARARALRAAGQPARAHLWLVSLDRKRSERRKTRQDLPAKSA